MKMDQVRCDICNRDNYLPIGPVKENLMVACQDCGHVYLLYRPAIKELQKIYNDEYFNDKYIRENVSTSYNYLDDKPNIVKFAQTRFDTIEKYIQPGKVLDIGCAMGFYLEHARSRGWEPYGLEVSEYAARHAIDELKLNVQTGALEAAVYPDEEFAAVTMWLVLEHMIKPVEALKKVWGLLRPGGILGIKVPNIGGITFRLDRQKWLDQHAEDHFCDYKPGTLANLLVNTGFKVLEYMTEGIYYERALAGLGLSLPKVIELDEEAKKWFVEFYQKLAGQIDLGDSLVMFAQKQE